METDEQLRKFYINSNWLLWITSLKTGIFQQLELYLQNPFSAPYAGSACPNGFQNRTALDCFKKGI